MHPGILGESTSALSRNPHRIAVLRCSLSPLGLMEHSRLFSLIGLLAILAIALPQETSAEDVRDQFVYIGTYTRGESRGIAVLRMHGKTGALTPVHVADSEDPSFLAIHPNRRFLYAVNEIGRFRDQKAGAVSAFAIDPESGKLTALNQQSSVGPGPCHLVVDGGGKNVLVANYGGGSVACLPIRQDGTLAEASSFIQHTGSSVTPRQKAPHAHSIHVSPQNRFACAADLGLDQILVYRFDPTSGNLAPHDPPATGLKPGSGPRHFAFHPDGRRAWVINELTSTVTGFHWDEETGRLKPAETLSTLPAEFDGRNSTAEIQVHPGGRFVYGSNRGHNSIAIFAIEGDSTRLKAVGHVSTGGSTPRNFGISPDGRWLLAANQQSDSVIVFRIDPETGNLQRTKHEIRVASPVCVKFLPISD